MILNSCFVFVCLPSTLSFQVTAASLALVGLVQFLLCAAIIHRSAKRLRLDAGPSTKDLDVEERK
jgi:hypothetical protein